jgi:hypothetical protein
MWSRIENTHSIIIIIRRRRSASGKKGISQYFFFFLWDTPTDLQQKIFQRIIVVFDIVCIKKYQDYY